MAQEAGQIVFRAEVDDTGAITGLKRFKKGIEQAGASSKGLFGDIERLGSSAGALTKTFIGFATAGLGALMALSKDAPAVADELAKIDIEGIKLTHTLGSILEPVWKSLANNVMPAFNSFLTDNKELFTDIATQIGVATNALAGYFSELYSGVPELAGGDEIVSQKDIGGGVSINQTRREMLGPFTESAALIEHGQQLASEGDWAGLLGNSLKLTIQFMVDAAQSVGGIDRKETDSLSGSVS